LNLGLAVAFSSPPCLALKKEIQMTQGLKRLYGQGHLHFITFSCYHRLPLLATPSSRDVFVDELDIVRDDMKFSLIGYVVMPEHVHLLMGEPKNVTLSIALHRLKLRVSRKLRTAALIRAATPSFWQPRFYDFNIYSEGKKKEKLHYMHANPVTRELVYHPQCWPWSSWSFYYADDPTTILIDLVC
jgi:putative transposase